MKKTRKRNPKELPDQIIRELAAIGLARATDCLYIREGKVELKTAQEMDTEDAAAIAAIEKTASGWKVKFYDKLKALELLGSHLGMFGNSTQPSESENNLLEAILAATREELQTDDIPEVQ